MKLMASVCSALLATMILGCAREPTAEGRRSLEFITKIAETGFPPRCQVTITRKIAGGPVDSITSAEDRTVVEGTVDCNPMLGLSEILCKC